MSSDRGQWPIRPYWIDIAWGAFAVANLAAMLVLPTWETVPFHFIWVSLTLLYGFRVWKRRPTAWTLVAVMVATALAIGVDVARGAQPLDEITEVPLMAAMFVAMVWHARRRLAAMAEIARVSDENLRLLERERRFVQDASHELGTPLTIALGQVELIARTADDALMKEDAEIAVDELMRLRRLADRLLVLASSEDPEFLHRTPIDIDGLIEDALRRWASIPRTWVRGDRSNAIGDSDADRLAMALDSLIENAVKHTDTGDRIAVGARSNGMAVRITVADSGTGIAESNREHIFDRFARVDTGRARREGGVGLGLSIVKAIAEAHGGGVGLQSTEGVGSSFWFTVPLAASPLGAPVLEVGSSVDSHS
jgi:signal transduction histidine kinase